LGYKEFHFMLTQDTATHIRAEAAKALVGQEEPFTQLLIAMFSGGHVLLEGVPGTAKTLMAKTLAGLTQAEFKRVQFTPDLMPSDVIGTQVFEMGSGQFRLQRGPIFTNVLLGDEINRAPAKTQSALLEAMEEHQVTIDGQRLPLPEPFFVLATQNPVEYEGTYPLPEAQLDRFLFKVLVDYAPQEVEIEVLRRYHNGFDARHLDALDLQRSVTPATLAECQQEIRAVQVDEGILK
jgi:MoxR-like ATPase